MVAWWVPAVSPQQEWLCSSPWTHTRSVSWAWGIHERIPAGCDWWLPNYYTVFFRGGNFDSWMQSMLRASMIFINFRRRNYDKATLTQLSDLLFHVSDNTDLVFQPYYFPAVDAAMDQRSLPLGYSFLGNEPDPTVCCDLRDCQRQQAVDYKRLTVATLFTPNAWEIHVATLVRVRQMQTVHVCALFAILCLKTE